MLWHLLLCQMSQTRHWRGILERVSSTTSSFPRKYSAFGLNLIRPIRRRWHLRCTLSRSCWLNSGTNVLWSVIRRNDGMGCANVLLRLRGPYLTSESTFWLWRRLLRRLSKRSSLSTTALFRTMLTRRTPGRSCSTYLWNDSAFNYRWLFECQQCTIFNYLWISSIID